MGTTPSAKPKVDKVVTQRVRYRIEGLGLQDALLRGLAEKLFEAPTRASPRLLMIYLPDQSVIIQQWESRSGKAGLVVEGDVDSPSLKHLVDLVSSLGGEPKS